MSRDYRKQIAEETVAIIEKGFYINNQKHVIDLKSQINNMVGNTILYQETNHASLVLKNEKNESKKTVFRTVNATTLNAILELNKKAEGGVVALNFASARNPGGGFLNGSQAQEESLARTTVLYASLKSKNEFYEYHREQKNPIYSHKIIYSADVPIIRDEKEELLDTPASCSFITSPAVNLKDIKEKRLGYTQTEIDQIMLERIRYILRIAKYHGYTHLVMGAFGCGVFGNSAYKVSEYFQILLKQDEEFKNVFDEVVFAVLDTTPNKQNILPFANKFR